MTSPKKKLPTGPIRITQPLFSPPEISTAYNSESDIKLVDSLQESRKQDLSRQESSKQESSNIVSPNEQAIKENNSNGKTNKLESRKQDSSLQDDKEARKHKQDYLTDVNALVDSSKPETRKQDLTVDEVEYVKVAMRLSATSVERLRGLRNTTGLPYEILVDVMVSNWDNLPTKLQELFLSEAKLARIQRLIAGQDKAMKTVRSKLLG